MDIKHLSYEGFSFRYSVEGSGQPLIFVGGAFQSIDRLGPLSEHWRSHYQLILIELPGFGDSDFLPIEYDFDFTALCIEAVVNELSAENAIIIGFSYGSPSVYRYVANNQQRVKAMILGGTCTTLDKVMEYQVRMMLWLVRSEKSHLFPQMFAEVMCNREVRDIPNAKRIFEIVTRSLSRMKEEEREKFFANSMRLLNSKMPNKKINVPTLAFTGEHDKFTRAERLSDYSKYCWDLRIVRVPKADHMCHLVQTKATLQLIDTFIGSVDQTTLQIAS